MIEFARRSDWRIPEHFTADWTPLPDFNVDNPGDQFKPYGFMLLFFLLLAPPLNRWFFGIVEWFYGLSGVAPDWAYAGMHLTRFWNAWL